jgi:hypothetical protein
MIEFNKKRWSAVLPFSSSSVYKSQCKILTKRDGQQFYPFLLLLFIDSYKQEEEEKGRTADHLFL